MIKGKRQLKARFTALKEGKPMLRRVQLAAVQEAKYRVPRKTGNLGRTIRVGDLRGDYMEIVAGGTRDVGYAAAVEFGSKPHDIVPRSAKVLAWPNTRGGAKVRLSGRLRRSEYVKGTDRARKGALAFARRVKHPGTRAQPYLGPGLKKAVGDLTGIIVDIWNDAA